MIKVFQRREFLDQLERTAWAARKIKMKMTAIHFLSSCTHLKSSQKFIVLSFVLSFMNKIQKAKFAMLCGCRLSGEQNGFKSAFIVLRFNSGK